MYYPVAFQAHEKLSSIVKQHSIKISMDSRLGFSPAFFEDSFIDGLFTSVQRKPFSL